MRFIQLAMVFFVLLFSCSPKVKDKVAYLAAAKTVLAAPVLECNHLFFIDSTEITMKFSLADAKIRYTLDGTDVTQSSNTYEKPIQVYETTLIKAKSFHPEFQSSTSNSLKAVKTNSLLTGSKIRITPQPNELYQANGTLSLTDHNKGTASFANGNDWLGFQSNGIGITIDFPEPKHLTKVTVSTLTNHGAWIFLPKNITVFSGGKEIGTTDLQQPTREDTSGLEFIEVPIKENTYTNLRIAVSSLNEIPEWHQGKGTLPWFFTDEILVE